MYAQSQHAGYVAIAVVAVGAVVLAVLRLGRSNLSTRG
jgi:hypothetical protein